MRVATRVKREFHNAAGGSRKRRLEQAERLAHRALEVETEKIERKNEYDSPSILRARCSPLDVLPVLLQKRHLCRKQKH